MGRTAKAEWQQDFEGEPDIRRVRHNPKPQGIPQKPGQLPPKISQVWDNLVPKLVKVGVATDLDETTLLALCQWWVVYLDASAKLTGDFSDSAQRTLLGQVQKAWQEYKRLAESFGLTPKSRSLVNVAPATNEDESEFFED